MLQSSTGTETVQNNLPQRTTSFVGREQQIKEVRDLLATSPLVTLVGAGGSGKTRLALQVAASLMASEVDDTWEDGVWLIEIAGLSDPAFLYGAVARVLDVRERPGWPISMRRAGRFLPVSMMPSETSWRRRRLTAEH